MVEHQKPDAKRSWKPLKERGRLAMSGSFWLETPQLKYPQDEMGSQKEPWQDYSCAPGKTVSPSPHLPPPHFSLG